MSSETDKLRSETARMLEDQRAQLAIELEALNDLSSRAIKEAKRGKAYDVKLGSHVAWIARQRAEVLSHLRQLEKHDRVMSRTPEQRFLLVCEYLRSEASPIQRAELAAILSEMDQGRSVLS